MRRRALLTAGATALGATAGCLSRFDGTNAVDGDGGADGSNTPDDDGTLDPPEDAEHRLYVENFDAESHLVDVRVTDADTGDVVLAGRYEAPDGRGVEFPELAVRGETYEVSVSLPGAGLTRAFEWTARSCSGSEAPGGSRNGSVRIAEGLAEVTFVDDACDALTAGAQVPTGPAEYFAVDGYTPPSATVTGTTPGEDDRCSPRLEVGRAADGTAAPDESTVVYEDLPPDRRDEFDAARGSTGVDLGGDYDFWVEDARYVVRDGRTYRTAVSVC